MTATAHSGAAALPVRPGEKRWTEREIAEVRDRLAKEAAAQRADIERAESDIAKRYFNRVAKRTTNLASTNKTQVRAFRFPVPPLAEQIEIADAMSASKATLASIKHKLGTLQQLKRTLLHDLLTGAARVDVLFNAEATA